MFVPVNSRPKFKVYYLLKICGLWYCNDVMILLGMYSIHPNIEHSKSGRRVRISNGASLYRFVNKGHKKFMTKLSRLAKNFRSGFQMVAAILFLPFENRTFFVWILNVH